MFTDNETNLAKLYGAKNPNPYVKDAFHEYIINGVEEGVNPEMVGTKAAAYYCISAPAGEEVTIRLRLFSSEEASTNPFDQDFDKIFQRRQNENEEYYAQIIPSYLSPHEEVVVRQAYAGLLWNKQFYHYGVKDWLDGDPSQAPVPSSDYRRTDLVSIKLPTYRSFGTLPLFLRR